MGKKRFEKPKKKVNRSLDGQIGGGKQFQADR